MEQPQHENAELRRLARMMKNVAFASVAMNFVLFVYYVLMAPAGEGALTVYCSRDEGR